MLMLFTPSLLLASAFFIVRGGRACRSYWLAWAGLAATMIGDYFLAVKSSPLDSAGFLCGVAGFALAHLCWIGFLLRHARWSPRIAFGLTFSLGLFFAARMFPAVESPLLLAALSVYTFISIISVSLACGTHRLSSAWRYGLSLLLFSDAMIAFGRILRVPFLNNLVGITYLASLLCVATAICRCSVCPRPHARFRKLRQAPLFVLLGGPLAMALFLCAMRVCPVTPHYNPFMKMLSYLGRTTINGVEYPLCHYLFSFALAASAYVSARFFPALSCFVRGTRKKTVFLWAGAFNAAGLLAIALIPENVRCDLHNVGCFAAVGGGATMLLLMTPARNNRRAPGSVRWGLLAWSMTLVALFQLSLLGHRHKIMPFSPYVPTLQKMLIMTFVAWLTYYAVLLYRVTRRDIAFPLFQKKLTLLIALGALAAAADTSPLPMDKNDWLANPIVWKFRDETITCVLTNGNETAVYEKAPLSSAVTVDATFTPAAADCKSWAVAAVAVTADRDNFWHLALVQSPADNGRRPFLELCEMRDGNWLAQNDLKMEVNETTGKTWTFGQPHRLLLSMENGRVEGSVFGPDGALLLRRRYALNADAVARGRPAVRVAGFTGTFSGLRALWGAAIPEDTGQRKVFPAYDVANGLSDIRDKATGFFRVVKKPDGRWWAIDPLGRGVVLLGVDHVTFNGHWCEKLGYAPHGKKNRAKYPDKAVWERETLDRLKQWGFNMLGAGCDHELRHRGMIHTVFLNIGDSFTRLDGDYQITPHENRPCSAFPNVFHPDFETYCRFLARQKCAPNRNDPWLFGYFIDNELAWWGRGELKTGLFDAVMRKNADHTAKSALRDFLARQCGNDLAAFNRLWDTDLKSFDSLLSLDRLPARNDNQKAVKYDFLRHVAEVYFSLASKAIRDVDPNHIVMGARFAGTGGAAPAVWEVSGKYCEVVTFNCYPMADLDKGIVYNHFGKTGEPVAAHFEEYYNHVKRPMLITEWSFPALDAGLPSVYGAGQRFRTQTGRTAATSLFARTMLSLPFLLGYDYFMWVDEPALGISSDFPEDSNYGLINEEGAPYELLTAMFAGLHREAAAWRFRDLPKPFAPKPSRVLPAAFSVALNVSAAASSESFFRREGEAFTAGNGRLVLKGKLGEGRMVRQIMLDNEAKSFGEYNAMLHTIDGGGNNRWTETRDVKAVTGRVENGIAVLDITAGGGNGPERFEAVHRLLLPAGTAWFISEIVSVRNTGEKPLDIKSLYFRLNSEFKDLPGKQPPNLWGAPQTGVWLDNADGRFFGAVASRLSGIKIYFWVNPQGGVHPDARWEIEQLELRPGASFVPDSPVYLVCAAGTGGETNWKIYVDAIVPLLSGAP